MLTEDMLKAAITAAYQAGGEPEMISCRGVLLSAKHPDMTSDDMGDSWRPLTDSEVVIVAEVWAEARAAVGIRTEGE